MDPYSNNTPQCFLQTGRNDLYFNRLPQTSRNQLFEVTQAINQWKSSQKFYVFFNTEEIVERNLKKRLQLRNKCKSHKNYSLYPVFIFAEPRRLSSLMFHNKPNRGMCKCLWKTRVRVKHVVRTCHVH